MTARPRPRRDGLEPAAGIALGGAAAVLVAAMLFPFREHLSNTSVALLLVVVVMAAAIIGGRAAGITSAVAAVLAFDFFHTVPYLRLTIASWDDVETAILLGVVGIVVGTVAAGRGVAIHHVEEGRAEIRRVHRVAERLAAGARPDQVIDACVVELTELLLLAECRYEAHPIDSDLTVLCRTGAMPASPIHRRVATGLALPAEGLALEVLASGRSAGRFVLVPRPDAGATLDHRLVAIALADIAGAAIAAAASVPVNGR